MKNLFFAALVAVVAVGSAYAQEYSTEPFSAGIQFSCTEVNEAPTCDDELTSADVYEIDSNTPITLSAQELDRQYVQF